MRAPEAPGNYRLEGKMPVREPDVLAWVSWFETAERHVADEDVGGVRVSTVFLGTDYNFTGRGPPALFETMVFGGPLDQEQVRYATWGEAERGHAEMVARVRAAGGSE